MEVSEYITSVVDLPPVANGSAGSQFYWLGDVVEDERWDDMLSSYVAPELVVAIAGGRDPRARPSLGVAGANTGAPFHSHGSFFAEVLHGKKLWFFAPPGTGLRSARTGAYRPGMSMFDWLDEVLPSLPRAKRPIACTLSAGDIVYGPGGWEHATLNLDPFNAYVSIFTDGDGHGGSYRSGEFATCNAGLRDCSADIDCQRYFECLQSATGNDQTCRPLRTPNIASILDNMRVCDAPRARRRQRAAAGL